MTITTPLQVHEYDDDITRWLAEDIGRGDITSSVFVDQDAQAKCAIIAREPVILSGLPLAALVFIRHDATLKVQQQAQDGTSIAAGDTVLTVSGNARRVLEAERTALNLLSYLSGIATYTAACVAETKGTDCVILDTRKTLPGYRALAKYAVRCGGGQNHRMRLDDGVMIKDNHIAAAGGISQAMQQARRNVPSLTKIEVECDRLEQVEDALAMRADVILLDNMSAETVRRAVALVGGRARLEASGGITREMIAEYAATGVDYISLGALTHTVRAVDFGLDWQKS